MKKDIKTLWKMFLVFFRIGAFTIGGGLAMIPIIEREVVDKNKWVNEEEIVDVFAISQSVPGVIAINSSIFIGYKIAGFAGSVAAALGVILPSLIIILSIAFLLTNVQDNIYLQKAFNGVRSGVTALILLSCIKLGKAAIKDKYGIISGIAAFICIIVLDINAIYVIFAGGVLGYLYYSFWRLRKS